MIQDNKTVISPGEDWVVCSVLIKTQNAGRDHHAKREHAQVNVGVSRKINNKSLTKSLYKECEGFAPLAQYS